MGSFTILLPAVALVAIYISSVEAAANCPLPSKIYGCSPRCLQDYDCSHGKKCCSDSCNTKTCVDLATFGNTNSNSKYGQSGATGVYCNNEKCRPSEVCKQDPATRRMKCVRA